MQKDYVIAVLLTIPADSYEEALKEAEEVGEGLAQDASMGVQVVKDYERDNYGGQRIVYLPSEDGEEEHDTIPSPALTHNHFGEALHPDTCAACAARLASKLASKE